jgi:hypothetical protein
LAITDSPFSSRSTIAAVISSGTIEHRNKPTNTTGDNRTRIVQDYRTFAQDNSVLVLIIVVLVEGVADLYVVFVLVLVIAFAVLVLVLQVAVEKITATEE